MDGCEPPWGFSELNAGPLKEQQCSQLGVSPAHSSVLLTGEIKEIPEFGFELVHILQRGESSEKSVLHASREQHCQGRPDLSQGMMWLVKIKLKKVITSSLISKSNY